MFFKSSAPYIEENLRDLGECQRINLSPWEAWSETFWMFLILLMSLKGHLKFLCFKQNYLFHSICSGSSLFVFAHDQKKTNCNIRFWSRPSIIRRQNRSEVSDADVFFKVRVFKSLYSFDSVSELQLLTSFRCS